MSGGPRDSRRCWSRAFWAVLHHRTGRCSVGLCTRSTIAFFTWIISPRRAYCWVLGQECAFHIPISKSTHIAAKTIELDDFIHSSVCCALLIEPRSTRKTSSRHESTTGGYWKDCYFDGLRGERRLRMVEDAYKDSRIEVSELNRELVR